MPGAVRRRIQPAPGQLTLGFEEDPLAIRKAVEALIHSAEPAAQLIHEFAVRRGAGRIDLVAIGRELSGWEIKGGRDNLARLPRQVDMFSQVFERLTLVAAERHMDAAEKCVPGWWGLMLVRDGVVSLTRAAGTNPRRDPMAIAELLWRDEAMAIAEHRLGRRLSGPRRVLWKYLVDSATPSELSTLVRGALTQRRNWRAAAQQT
jgi:hypothetical protein